MDNFDDVIEQLVSIYSEKGFISDEIISKVILENKISTLKIDKIIEVLGQKGITISSFDDNTMQNNQSVQKMRTCSKLSERTNKYKKQQSKLINMSEKEVKELFFSDITNARVQSTYMPLVVLSFFEQADQYGNASLDAIVRCFQEFYDNRRKMGEIVEREDSIFVTSAPSDNEVKRLILFNPLGRSCLVRYFIYNKEIKTISLIENLWNSLLVADEKRINKIMVGLIEQYYEKLLIMRQK